MTIVLIAGSGRSGSTYLERAICDDNSAIAIGEMKYVWQRGCLRNETCSCGKPFDSCNFWNAVLVDAFGVKFNTADAERLRLSVERHRKFFMHQILGLNSNSYTSNREVYTDMLQSMYQSIYKISKREIIIDSSKDPAHVELALSLGIPNYCLHLIRDCRAVVYSLQKPKLRPEVHWKTEYMAKTSSLVGIRDWVYINSALEVLARTKTVKRVLYEDIPSFNTKLMFNKNDTKLSSLMHSVSGNPNRFKSFQKFKLDDRWKSEMNEFDQYLVNILAGPLLLKYGYKLFGS